MKNISWKEWLVGDWAQWKGISSLRDEIAKLKTTQPIPTLVFREPGVEALLGLKQEKVDSSKNDESSALMTRTLVRYLIHKGIIDPKEFGELLDEMDK